MKDVLQILEEDARTSLEDIAAMTGRRVEEVQDIIKQAEQDRVILGYHSQINWAKAGNDLVWALIEVKVTPQRGVGFDAIAANIYRHPEARSLHLVSGQYDLAVTVAAPTMQEVASFVSEKLATLDAVQGTVTHFLLKRYKEQGVIFDGESHPQRQPMMP